MRQFLSLIPFRSIFCVLCFAWLFPPQSVNAQSCTPIENFEATQYNILKATYEWDIAQNVQYYVIDIKINAQPYLVKEMSGTASQFTVDFDPKLSNYDHVSATLTQYCPLGQSTSTTFDFVIVTDGVVYLNGGPQHGEPNAVEPVYAVNDNLIPTTEVCGLCDPGFFRLTSGFYGPYGIYVDPAIPHTIEQLRFVKSELCGCLDKAVSEGIMDINGGPGPKYTGQPFQCKLTPYVFEKRDCDRKNEGGKERSAPADISTLRAVPNPVTTNTGLSFTLPETSFITLSVYDFMGKLMDEAVQSMEMPAGEHLLELNTENWPAGLYYCTLRAGEVVQTVKVLKM